MLAKHTPAPFEPDKMIRNVLLDEMAKNHQYEIVTWPAYLPDEICMDMLRKNTNPNVMLYIANNHGITPIVTVGDHKAFVVSFDKRKKSKRPQPKFQTPFYNNTEPVEKRLRDQKDFA